MRWVAVRRAFAASFVPFFMGCGGDGTGPVLTEPLVQVANGLRHSCGLTAAGAAFCWGGNRDGQLGDGATVDHSVPVGVPGGLNFASVSAGGGHTCGLTADGMAYCWGLNLSGQLGIGTSGEVPNPEPLPVSSGSVRFSLIEAGGGSYTCGLALDGAAYCWGWNNFGQLGDGTEVDKNSPVLVATAEKFADLSVGAFHTCGVTEVGAVWCWGANNYGQLGGGTTSEANALTPQPVTGAELFSQVTVGFQHTCGLGMAGDVSCWGRNTVGQSGTSGANDNNVPTPIVSPGVSFLSVEAGSNYTCGLLLTGEGICWGSNDLGQLGHLSAQVCTDSATAAVFGCTPVPTVVGTSLRFGALSTGAHHTCGISADLLAYCWGGGTVGELGDGRSGPTYSTVTPQRVSGQEGTAQS